MGKATDLFDIKSDPIPVEDESVKEPVRRKYMERPRPGPRPDNPHYELGMEAVELLDESKANGAGSAGEDRREPEPDTVVDDAVAEPDEQEERIAAAPDTATACPDCAEYRKRLESVRSQLEETRQFLGLITKILP